ncbi:MAG TPA: tetratricopeptide repeat protein [Elainellaceae cyanobacterium]
MLTNDRKCIQTPQTHHPSYPTLPVDASYESLGMAMHQQGKWDAAIDYYCQAIAHQPSAPRYFNLGVVYDQQGQLDEAVRCYSQAIALAPDYANAYSNLGCVWLKQGKLSDAIAIFQQAIARMPTASLHNNLGQALYADGQLDAAIAAYRHAIQIQPDLAQAHFNLGCLWQQQRHDSEAIACFEEVIQHDPDRLAAYSRCGQLLFDQGHFSRALAYWQQAIARQPAFVDAYCQRIDSTAQSSDALDQARAACVQFLTALRHTPIGHKAPHDLAQTYHRLGDLLAGYGGIAQAEAYYRKALQIEPQTAELYPKLGDCLARQQRFDAALMVYHIALIQQPNYPGLHARIGYSLERQQRFQQAIGYYQTALRSPAPKHTADIFSDVNSSSSFEVPTRIYSNPRWVVSGGAGGARPTAHTQFTSDLGSLYRATRAWVAATKQEGVTYVPVVWGRGQRLDILTGDRVQVRDGQDANDVEFDTTDCILLDSSSHTLKPDPQCGGVTCQSCMARLRSEFEPIQCREGVYRCSRTTPLDGLHPPTFVVTIPDGRAWIAPQQQSWRVCDGIAIITPDGALLSDLSRSYPWYLPGCDRHDPRQHRFFQLDNLPPVERIPGRVAVLSGLSGHVYYHWMIDVLPRVEILRRGKLDLTEIDYFVVNNINQSFQRDTLAMLGLSPEKLICSDRHPHIQADELIVPSFPGHLDWVPPETLTVLRQMFARAVDSTPDSAPTDCPKRLYISRSKARYRHVLNETEVIDQLQPLGFVPVVLESLPVSRQIELFAHADIIVSPHGAGLTNLIFCKTGAQVVELTSPHYVRTDYWVISHQLGLSHYFIQGERFECHPLRQIMYQNPLTEDILISKQSLHAVMQHLDL